MSKWIKNKFVLSVILVCVLALSWRLSGCGGPAVPGDNENNQQSDNQSSKQETKKREPPIPAELPKTPIKVTWTKALQDARLFHYVMWQNSPAIWFTQDGKSVLREVFAREAVGDSQLGFKDRTTYTGSLEDVYVKDNKMYVVGTLNDTRIGGAMLVTSGF